MGKIQTAIDISVLPLWVSLILFCIVIASFLIILYLALFRSKDIKFFFGLLEIKNSGLKISKADSEEVINKYDGNWDIIGKDIEFPGHRFSTKYIYEATVNFAISRFEVELSGNLIYRNRLSNEKIFETKIKGFGYLVDGMGSITYETYSILYKKRQTTGNGVLLLRFNLDGRAGKGYFMTSNDAQFEVRLGMVNLNRVF